MPRKEMSEGGSREHIFTCCFTSLAVPPDLGQIDFIVQHLYVPERCCLVFYLLISFTLGFLVLM